MLLFLFTFTFTQAQERSATVTAEQMRDMARTTSVPDHRSVETKGTPFFNEEFVNGTVTFKNEQTTNVLPIRFNSYEGTVQFMESGDIYAIDSKTIKEFEIYASDGIIRFSKGYEARRLSQDDFVAVLADGEAKFMIKYSVNYRENVSGYGQATQVEEYSQSENYYVKFGESDVDRIRSLNKRRVMGAFPSHTDQLEQFANQHNIRFDNVRDVARLFDHYNTVTSEQSK